MEHNRNSFSQRSLRLLHIINPKGALAMGCLLLFIPMLAYGSEQWFNYDEASWLREHAGIYVWEKDARFNDYTLQELVGKAKELGTKIIRVPVNAFYGGKEDFPQVLSSPAYRRIFDEFSVIILTMWDWSGRQYDEEWTEKVYYDAAHYLLEEYRGRGKTIIMGIWESDNWAPLDERGLLFFKARQRGIKRAKEELGEKGMRLIEMIEVNRVDLKGGDCVTNVILAKVRPEMVSLSSWAHLDNLSATLDYIASKVGHRNIMIGEVGLERKNCRKEEEVRDFIMSRVREAMKWGVQYFILWQLSDWANGFLDCKENEGKRMTAWFPFYRAFHLDDELLCVEDFKEIRTDEDGTPLNLLGGENGEGILLLYNGVSALWLGKHLPNWATSLKGLPLGKYKLLIIPFEGKGKVVLEDENGNLACLELRETIRLEEFKRKGVELDKASKLRILFTAGEQLLIGGIYLAKKETKVPFRVEGDNVTIVTGIEGNKAIPIFEGEWQVERVEVEAYEEIEDARLKGKEGTCLIAKFLPARSKIVLASDGRGYFLLPNIRTTQEKEWGLFKRENLQWNEDFNIFLPSVKGEECRLSLRLSLPYNIVGGEIWLTGEKSREGDWWVEVKDYSGEWRKCPSLFYYPGVPQDLKVSLPADFPTIWGPIRDIEIAWVIRTEEEISWQWSTCILSVRAKLLLDTLSSSLPRVEGKLQWFQRKGKGQVRLLLSRR